jgi:hypothetical protein
MSTEAARNEMRFAHQYIEAFYKTKDVPRRQQHLEHALRYIAKARTFDPAATIEVKTTDNKIGVATLDLMESEVLFHQANVIDAHKTTEEHRRIVIPKLKQAIDLSPNIPTYQVVLANMYMADNNRNAAISLLQQAQQNFPLDFHVRATLDDIQAKPAWGLPPVSTNMSPAGILFLFMVIVFAVALVAFTMRPH